MKVKAKWSEATSFANPEAEILEDTVDLASSVFLKHDTLTSWSPVILLMEPFSPKICSIFLQNVEIPSCMFSLDHFQGNNSSLFWKSVPHVFFWYFW